MRTTGGQVEDHDDGRTEHAGQNAEHGKKIVAREEGPRHEDDDSGNRREDAPHQEGPTGQGRVNALPPESSVGEGGSQLRTGHGHRGGKGIGGIHRGEHGAGRDRDASGFEQPALHAGEDRKRPPFEAEGDGNPDPAQVAQNSERRRQGMAPRHGDGGEDGHADDHACRSGPVPLGGVVGSRIRRFRLDVNDGYVERLVTIPGSRPRDGGGGRFHRPEDACHLSSRRCRRTPREGPGSSARSWRRWQPSRVWPQRSPARPGRLPGRDCR